MLAGKQYQDDVQQMRDERKQARERFMLVTEKIETMLDSFHSDEGNHLIPIKDFMHLEVGVPLHVNDKVYFVRQEYKPNVIFFKTYLKAGGSFGKQSHDVKEICKVIKGVLIEGMQNDKRIEVGEVIEYPAHEIHKPYTDQETIVHVYFHISENLNVTPANPEQ